MKTNLWIWVKRALYLLAWAAIVSLMLSACDKEPETTAIQQYDEEVLYYDNNNHNPKWSPDTIQKYAADKHVRYIYITIAPGETFTHLQSMDIAWKRRELQFVMKESAKCRGRGNFIFVSGACMRADSVDLVEMGFTINQQNQQ